jgi:hypothetical protein
MRKCEFFSESSLWEEFGAYLYFRLKYDFSLNELIEVSQVYFRSWVIDCRAAYECFHHIVSTCFIN